MAGLADIPIFGNKIDRAGGLFMLTQFLWTYSQFIQERKGSTFYIHSKLYKKVIPQTEYAMHYSDYLDN